MSTATFSHSAHFLSTVREMFAGWFDSRTAKTARPLTRFEEAEQLRAMADDVAQSDAFSVLATLLSSVAHGPV